MALPKNLPVVQGLSGDAARALRVPQLNPGFGMCCMAWHVVGRHHARCPLFGALRYQDVVTK